uniref:Uncharacterized protein LOC114331126 n=1 Tax=Diabrotica virgifera virgifera TaxID=50390 RepID=A0A6P7FK81_DIAVI
MPRLKSFNKKSTKRSHTLTKYQKNKKEYKEAVQSTSSDIHEFSFISSEEYESINNHPLEFQKEQEEQTVLKGHRIVDLYYVLQWALNLQFAHSKVCTMGNLHIVDEKQKGLVSTVVLLCNMCGYKTEKSTENPSEQSAVNYGAVWGTLSTGGTYTQLTGLLGALDIPSMPYRLFHMFLDTIFGILSLPILSMCPKYLTEARALLTNNKIKELQNCCTKIINTAAYSDVENLKSNLQKSIDHVFGNHAMCSDQYCTEQQSDAHLMTSVKNTGLYFHINGSLQRLISKGHRLIDKETNNRAEMYMSILCKFNAGKRLNLSGRGSFRCRSAISGLRYNEGVEWQEKEWRSILKRSPGKYFKRNIKQNQRAVELKSKRKLDFVSHYRKKRSRSIKNNTDYGPHALQPALTENEYQSEHSRILKAIQVQPEEI